MFTQATAEIYDPTTGIFAPTGNLATGRYSHTATLLNNGTVLIAGGLDEWGNILASAEIYDPATGTFTLTGSLNTARKAHTATLLNNGMVLVVGGTSGWGSDTDLSSAELYDPANGTFSNTGSLLTARSSATANLLKAGMVLIAGGWDINNTALRSAELYDPNGGNFSATGGLLTGRGSHTATLLNNGTILITGGWDINSNILDSTELYDPVAGTFATTGSLNTARSLATAMFSTTARFSLPAAWMKTTRLLPVWNMSAHLVIPPGLVSIVISPADPSISGGSSQRFTATGTFNDSSSQTLVSATWSSSDLSITILSNDATNYGDAMGVGQGTATVSACTGSICGSTTLTVQGPSISTLSPSSGGWGTTVTIVGSRFGATQGSSTVTFNGTTASVTSWSAVAASSPKFAPGATSGNVVVTVGVASNAMPFTVPPPNIASLTLTSAR